MLKTVIGHKSPSEFTYARVVLQRHLPVYFSRKSAIPSAVCLIDLLHADNAKDKNSLN